MINNVLVERDWKRDRESQMEFQMILTKNNVSSDLASMLERRMGSDWSNYGPSFFREKIVYTQDGKQWQFDVHDIMPFIPEKNPDYPEYGCRYGLRDEVRKYRNILLTRLLCEALDSISDR